jgi:hypothetical protein
MLLKGVVKARRVFVGLVVLAVVELVHDQVIGDFRQVGEGEEFSKALGTHLAD